MAQPNEPQTSYHSMDAQELVHRREHEMARQEDNLDEIHLGVVRLKHQAGAINDEVMDQGRLIDDIDKRMDGAQVDLERGEKKAREVNTKKAKVCKLYGVIAVLVVGEILLSIFKVDMFPK